MKRIGLFLDSEPFGGGKFQYSLSMLEALLSLPKKEFCCVVGYSSNVWEKKINSPDIESFFLPRDFPRWLFDRVWRNLGLSIPFWQRLCSKYFTFSRTLLQKKCDLWIFPSEDNLAYQLPVPSIVTIFDLMHIYERRFPEVGAYGRFGRREYHFKNICRWGKGVLVDSEVGKKQVIDSYKVNSEKVFVLPFVAPSYIFSERANNSFDDKYQLPKKYLFYPAQFWEHKNHNRLINAIYQLKSQLSDLKLVLVGSKKNAYHSILENVKKLGLQNDVIFLGYVPDEDIGEIYRRARALVMPTFFGPTNIPPLEAFATGCPVAISGIYGMPEQLGNAALYFNPLSEEEISESIKKLWQNDQVCLDLSQKGATRLKFWNQNTFNQKVSEILAKVLEKSD
ncbi:MAG: glycosyltransferase family 4 protein [Candidatus Riflebacteria bacterium]|nr:glycosyltransferase family 4 protein [Candidatus Riflebacteria bacterium]